MIEVPVYGLDGSEKSKISLPEVFSTPYRPDIIHRVYVSQFTHTLQPQGRDPLAGKRTSAQSWQTGRGVARVPRVKGERFSRSGMAAGVASVVKGRLPHPPRAEKVIYKRVNKKERRLALASAISATALRDVVEGRGHRIQNVPSLPLVVASDLEEVTKVKDLISAFKLWGLEDEIKRIKYGMKRRSGKARRRGRTRYVPVGPLIVTSSDGLRVKNVAENIAGVKVVDVNSLSVLDLVTGGHPIRFVIWTEPAVKMLDERFKMMVA
ncbi:MAG: 50S ribosomal protein L4 [Nitrososphaeria archaeon]